MTRFKSGDVITNQFETFLILKFLQKDEIYLSEDYEVLILNTKFIFRRIGAFTKIRLSETSDAYVKL